MVSDRAALPVKLATLPGVREYGDHEPVEIWLEENGRVVVRAYNECGNASTSVDLLDLLSWAKEAGFNGHSIASTMASLSDSK
jgi:hypothetical protein